MGRAPRRRRGWRLQRLGAADLLLAACLLVACAAGLAMLPGDERGDELRGRARAVDGDSIRIDGRDIRLAGIDAPELRQTCERAGRSWSCGEAARSALAVRLGRGETTCRLRGVDVYGRALAVCFAGGEELNAALVREGLAIGYGGYQREEAEARAARRGVWAGDFMTPREWRRLHPRPP